MDSCSWVMATRSSDHGPHTPPAAATPSAQNLYYFNNCIFVVNHPQVDHHLQPAAVPTRLQLFHEILKFVIPQLLALLQISTQTPDNQAATKLLALLITAFSLIIYSIAYGFYSCGTLSSAAPLYWVIVISGSVLVVAPVYLLFPIQKNGHIHYHFHSLFWLIVLLLGAFTLLWIWTCFLLLCSQHLLRRTSHPSVVHRLPAVPEEAHMWTIRSCALSPSKKLVWPLQV